MKYYFIHIFSVFRFSSMFHPNFYIHLCIVNKILLQQLHLNNQNYILLVKLFLYLKIFFSISAMTSMNVASSHPVGSGNPQLSSNSLPIYGQTTSHPLRDGFLMLLQSGSCRNYGRIQMLLFSYS